MARTDKLSTHRTTWEGNHDSGSVTYHTTRVVSWDADVITLNTGGWDTVTTRRKMNQTAKQFDLRFSVYQHKFRTYIETPYSDAVELTGDRATINRATGQVHAS